MESLTFVRMTERQFRVCAFSKALEMDYSSGKETLKVHFLALRISGI